MSLWVYFHLSPPLPGPKLPLHSIHDLYDLTSHFSIISPSTAFCLLSNQGSETVLTKVCGSFAMDNCSGCFSVCILLAVSAALRTWLCLDPWNMFSLDFLGLFFIFVWLQWWLVWTLHFPLTSWVLTWALISLNSAFQWLQFSSKCSLIWGIW